MRDKAECAWKMLDSAGKTMIAEETEKFNLELASSKMEIEIKELKWNLQVPKLKEFPYEAFLHLGFTHHRIILGGAKDYTERLRGFSARNLRYMRMFYEEWNEFDASDETVQIEQKSNLAFTSAKSPDTSGNDILQRCTCWNYQST